MGHRKHPNDFISTEVDINIGLSCNRALQNVIITSANRSVNLSRTPSLPHPNEGQNPGGKREIPVLLACTC